MAKMRKVVTLDGSGRIAVREEPVPEVAPGTVLVDVKAALVSPGTELGGVRAMRARPDASIPPRPFGYGNAGVVAAVGEGVRGIEPGMRLACMGGGYALHATQVVVPQNLTSPIPDGLSFEEAAFAHLAATGLHAVRRGEVVFGHHVLVMGLGLVGQLAAQISSASGAHVLGVDRLEMRRRLASECGAGAVSGAAGEALAAEAKAFSRGHGMDVAIVAFGGDATQAMQDIVKTMPLAPDTHRMGVIVIVGGASFEGSWPVPFGNIDVRASSRPGPGYHDDAWEHGADYPAAFVKWTTSRNLEECLRATAEGRMAVRPLITHRAPLEDAPAVCDELVEHPDRALGVILEP